MQTTIQRWGNSQGIRIPKQMLNELDIRAGDRVELTSTSDGITIKKPAQAMRHKTLQERLEAFYGKPIEKIGALPPQEEVDWGPPVGEEVW